MPAPMLSIVLPCYNEARNIPLLLARVRESAPLDPFELVLVNNGSTDNTAEVLKAELARPEYGFARTVPVPENVGYGHGIWTGLQAARGEYLAWSHADMQCDPADVFRGMTLLRFSREPTRTIVKGRRTGRPLVAALFALGMQAAALLILWRHMRDINGQPKVFHRSFLESLPSPPPDWAFDLYALYRARRTSRGVRSFPVTPARRARGGPTWALDLRSRLRRSLRVVRYMVALRGSG